MRITKGRGIRGVVDLKHPFDAEIKNDTDLEVKNENGEAVIVGTGMVVETVTRHFHSGRDVEFSGRFFVDGKASLCAVPWEPLSGDYTESAVIKVEKE